MSKIVIKKEILERSLANSIALCAAVIVYFLVLNISHIFAGIGSFAQMMSPFIYGFVIAYLLKNPMRHIEKLLSRMIKGKNSAALTRALSITFTLLLALVLLTGFISVIIPQLSDSISIFVSNLPSYMENVDRFTKSLIDSVDFNPAIVEEVLSTGQTFIAKLSELISTLLPAAVNALLSFSGKILDIIIGIVVSIYFLAGKERFTAQTKKLVTALMPEKAAAYDGKGSAHKQDIFKIYLRSAYGRSSAWDDMLHIHEHTEDAIRASGEHDSDSHQHHTGHRAIYRRGPVYIHNIDGKLSKSTWICGSCACAAADRWKYSCSKDSRRFNGAFGILGISCYICRRRIVWHYRSHTGGSNYGGCLQHNKGNNREEAQVKRQAGGYIGVPVKFGKMTQNS